METQKTRAGKKAVKAAGKKAGRKKGKGRRKTGEKETRPYRFGEFDILAVSLSPSTRNWGDFLFTVADWLIPDPKDPAIIFKYQPVPPAPNAEWTNDLVQCIAWRRSGITKRIRTAG